VKHQTTGNGEDAASPYDGYVVSRARQFSSSLVPLLGVLICIHMRMFEGMRAKITASAS